ncbi:hypothetical protein [Candidatus Amarolinea aalborgensis]|jgi:hypothetical protein|uniref:hypothetical protein n=1 Tax=Candidatus Amarolinea aalborgensis TaxID=2249329 RepID=UPI003BF9A08C
MNAEQETRAQLMSEAIARRTVTRRSFLGRVAQTTFTFLAAVAMNSAPTASARAKFGVQDCCVPPGPYCMDYGFQCNEDGTCKSPCWINLIYYPNQGGCWTCGGSVNPINCCDCWCRKAGCPSDRQCGCVSTNAPDTFNRHPRTVNANC